MRQVEKPKHLDHARSAPRLHVRGSGGAVALQIGDSMEYGDSRHASEPWPGQPRPGRARIVPLPQAKPAPGRPKKAHLPNITKCYDPVIPQSSLAHSQIMTMLSLFLALALCGIGHVYLQFAVREVRTQQHHVQEERRRLMQRVGQLEQENEALVDPVQLREYARTKLQMQETDPAQQVVTDIPEYLRNKYNGTMSNDNPDGLAELLAGSAPAGLVRLVPLLVEADKAFAARAK